MKMLDSAAFYTPSGNSPAVFLVYFWHSCYIPSTFEMHSRYSSCILSEFLDARTAFRSHSVSILTAFEQQSRHLPAGVIPAAIELQSYGIRLAFWTFWQHSKYSYWVSTTFELHSRANTLGMCKNHSLWVRGVLSIRTVFLQKMTIPPECDWNFENVSFRLIPAHSVSVCFEHAQNIPASHWNVPEYSKCTQNSVGPFRMHFEYQRMPSEFSFRRHSGSFRHSCD